MQQFGLQLSKSAFLDSSRRPTGANSPLLSRTSSAIHWNSSKILRDFSSVLRVDFSKKYVVWFFVFFYSAGKQVKSMIRSSFIHTSMTFTSFQERTSSGT